MFVIKGFMPHSRFANNTQGTVAAFGEISTLALTYALDKGIYKSTLSAEMELFTFTVAKDAAFLTLTSNQVDHIATILKWVYDHTLAVHGEIFADELLPDLMLTFATIASNFEIGDMVQDSNGYWAPAWISWTGVKVPGIDADNNIKIWLADDSFRNEYDDYSIVVVPPTTNLEDFFKTGTEVEKMLKSRTPSDVMYAIQQAKDDNPETTIRAETYAYHDPYTVEHLVDATFHLLIYGAAGNNIDAINDAIVDYLLTNSTRTRDEWIKILPDLFKRTEVVMIPLWSQYAIPNRELQAGINSPTTNLKKVVALVKQLVPSYPSAHIDNHLELTAHPYKSLAIAAVGSVDNRNGWFELTDIFPDYIAVSTTSNDFARMSLKTEEWAKVLNSMLLVAEKMGKYTSIPITMSKVTRDNILYLVSRYDNINYLVAAKSNFPTA